MNGYFKYMKPISRPVSNTQMHAPSSINQKFQLVYKQRDRYFILEQHSGMFLEFTKEAYNQLLLNKSTNEKIVSSQITDEFDILTKSGAFDPIDRLAEDSKTKIQSLNINISEKCNLACRYCFAEQGHYKQTATVMTKEKLKRIIDQATYALSEGESLNVILFGGEPLLRKDLVVFAIRYADDLQQRRGIRLIIDIFTNLTLLDDEIVNLLNSRENIRLLVSIDGPPEINDNNRKFCDGRKTSDVIEGKAKLLYGIARNRVLVRATLTEKKPKLVEKVRYFQQLGLTNISFDVAYCEQAKGIPSAKYLLAGLQSELRELGNYLCVQLKRGVEHNVNLLSEPISQILSNNKTRYVPQCPGGRQYLAVDANGDIYPCHFFVGHKKYRIGNILLDGVAFKNMSTDNGNMDLSKSAYGRCPECVFNAICEGPCPNKELLIFPRENGVITELCSMIRLRYIEALRILSIIYDSDSWPYLQEWERIVRKSSNGD